MPREHYDGRNAQFNNNNNKKPQISFRNKQIMLISSFFPLHLLQILYTHKNIWQVLYRNLIFLAYFIVWKRELLIVKNTFYRSISKWNEMWVVNRIKSDVQPGLYKIGNTASQMYDLGSSQAATYCSPFVQIQQTLSPELKPSTININQISLTGK